MVIHRDEGLDLVGLVDGRDDPQAIVVDVAHVSHARASCGRGALEGDGDVVLGSAAELSVFAEQVLANLRPDDDLGSGAGVHVSDRAFGWGRGFIHDYHLRSCS